jgi:hypothetical protein
MPGWKLSSNREKISSGVECQSLIGVRHFAFEIVMGRPVVAAERVELGVEVSDVAVGPEQAVHATLAVHHIGSRLC